MIYELITLLAAVLLAAVILYYARSSFRAAKPTVEDRRRARDAADAEYWAAWWAEREIGD